MPTALLGRRHWYLLCARVSFQAAEPLPFAVEDSGLREGTTQALQVVLGPQAQEGACFNFSARVL